MESIEARAKECYDELRRDLEEPGLNWPPIIARHMNALVATLLRELRDVTRERDSGGEALKADVAAWRERAEKAERERDAARADADRLADVVRRFLLWRNGPRACESALRAHDDLR